jgi:hypothetical protein
VYCHSLNENARATAKLAQYIEQFRSQTDRASLLLPQIPRVVFGDLTQRTLSHASSLTRVEDQSFTQRFDALFKMMEQNEATLKPGLSHHDDRVLDQLCSKEEKRYNDTLQAVTMNRDKLLTVECADAEVFLRRLQHATHALVALFDCVLTPPDLPPPSEDGTAFTRKSLKGIFDVL